MVRETSVHERVEVGHQGGSGERILRGPEVQAIANTRRTCVVQAGPQKPVAPRASTSPAPAAHGSAQLGRLGQLRTSGTDPGGPGRTAGPLQPAAVGRLCVITEDF